MLCTRYNSQLESREQSGAITNSPKVKPAGQEQINTDHIKISKISSQQSDPDTLKVDKDSEKQNINF